jgi:hypothetical protein
VLDRHGGKAGFGFGTIIKPETRKYKLSAPINENKTGK